MFDPASPPNPEINAAEPGDGESSGHPLFPRAYTETGADPRKFDVIQIIRYLPDGTREICPRYWKGSELRSWQQVLDEYGGECSYQLAAQCGKTHKYTAWSEKWFFSSPPRKPFGNGPVGGSTRHDPPAPQAPQATAHDVLVQMNLALIKMLVDKRDAPPPAPPNPIEMLREAGALLNGANRAPNPFEMVKEMLPLMNSGEQTSRTLKQGIELARELYKNNPAASSSPSRSSSDDMDGIMSIVKMITAVRPANQSAPAAPAAAAPAPNPPPQQQYAFAPPCPPPQGYGWMYTQQGWVAFPMAMPAYSPVVNRPAPISQPSAPPAPAARAVDEEAMLHAMLANPEIRAKLQTLLSSTSGTPAPAPIPPAPIPASPVASPAAGTPPSAPQAPASPAHTLSDLLTASGWSSTPPGEAPAAWHYTKPPAESSPAITAPASDHAPENTFEIPPDVPLDDELREMLAEPEFQEIALSLVPPEAQGAFAQLVQKNASRLRQTAEA